MPSETTVGADVLGEGDDRGGQGLADRVVVDAADEGAVELEDVRVHARDVAEGGEAGADVVDRDADAEVAQAVELGAQGDVVLDGLVLGDLDDERAGVVVAGDDERELVVLEHGGGDVQREVAALGQAVAWHSSASRITASSSSTPMSTACASRKQRSVGIAWPSASLKRASASAPTTRPLARSTIGWKATSSPKPSIMRCMRRGRARGGRRRGYALLVARARSRSATRFAVELVLELAQLLGDGDEADQQADGGNRELAGAQREATPTRQPSNSSRGPQVGERVERGQAQQREHAHVAPRHRAAGAPPPDDGDAGLRDHDQRESARIAAEKPSSRREIAERGGSDGGPGEEEGTQAAEDEQVASVGPTPASAMHGRGRQRDVPDQVARGGGVGALVDRAAVREHARQREQRQ